MKSECYFEHIKVIKNCFIFQSLECKKRQPMSSKNYILKFPNLFG